MESIASCLARAVETAHTTKRPSTYANYSTTRDIVLRIMREDIHKPLSHITHEWLLLFRDRLKSTGVCPNTIAAHMRNLRALVHDSIADKSIFHGIATNPQRTRKRSLTADMVRKIVSYVPPTEIQSRAKDFFLMMLLLNGTASVDIAYMPKGAYRGDHLEFNRHKSGIAVSVPLTSHVLKIVDKYRSHDSQSPFLFNFLDGSSGDEQQTYNDYRRLMHSVNRALRRIGDALGFTHSLTTYCARHTFASLALMAGNRTEDIKTCMGHTSVRTTEIYLCDLDTTIPSRVNESVVNVIESDTHIAQKPATNSYHQAGFRTLTCQVSLKIPYHISHKSGIPIHAHIDKIMRGNINLMGHALT